MTLKVVDLDVYYGNIRALHGVSLEVQEGEIVCLIGANGAGKTTCLSAVSGLLKPRRGHIRLGEEEITDWPAYTIARRGIAHVPEGRRIFPSLTVAENLDLGAYARKDRAALRLRSGWHLLSLLGRRRASRGAAVRADLERVFSLFPALADRQQQPGGTLSGGEQQMLAIGRALMARPRFLLLDEPSLGLAPFLVKQIFDTLQEINRAGTTLLLVEQNARLALSLARRGYVLETGRVVLEGPTAELANNEAVKKAYLGE